MAPHLPRFLPVILLFPFVSLVAHFPAASHGTPLPPTYDVSMCVDSPPFLCGGVEVHYPFYLANATADHSLAPFSCGYTDLKIACQDDGESKKTPIIQLGRDNYTVQAIFYNNNSLLLADTDVLRGGCPRVRHNVSFDKAWLRGNTSSHENLTFFFGCHSPLVGGVGDPGWELGSEMEKHRINCTEFSDPPGGGDSFVFTSEELDKTHEYDYLGVHCGEIVTVPIRNEVLDDLMASDQSSVLAKGGYGDVLRQGFELAWTRSTKDQCYRCESSGGRCAYGYDKAFLGCLCHGKVGDPYCKNSGASTVYPASKSSHPGPILRFYSSFRFCDHKTKRAQ